jgi:peptidoglycan/xylan/chitin deacetylase (PgdA/CDA1 family)
VSGLTLGPTYTNGGTSQPWCSITYDEHLGKNTQSILNAFAAAGMHGTFFTVGKELAAKPTLAQEILDLGHEIGNHSWNHARLTTLSDHGAAQLSLTNQRMASVVGFTPGTMRPPFGKLDAQVVNTATALGLATVKWNLAANIFETDPAVVTSRVLAGVARGVIVILHQVDSHAQALPGILSGLTARGLSSVPVAQLLGGALV